MSADPRECDHQRGMTYRSSAITLCHCCRDYLCSICGATIAWYAKMLVANPGVQWCYCAKDACIEAEATYHALPIDKMIQQRDMLRGKRTLTNLQDRGLAPRPSAPDAAMIQTSPRGLQRIVITPRLFKLDLGEACWCNLGKDCTGSHEIFLAEPVNHCGICGKTFQIVISDPHWSTGTWSCPLDTRSEDTQATSLVETELGNAAKTLEVVKNTVLHSSSLSHGLQHVQLTFPVKGQLFLHTADQHLFTITLARADAAGILSESPRYRVECRVCRLLVHEATVSLQAQISRHLSDTRARIDRISKAENASYALRMAVHKVNQQLRDDEGKFPRQQLGLEVLPTIEQAIRSPTLHRISLLDGAALRWLLHADHSKVPQ